MSKSDAEKVADLLKKSVSDDDVMDDDDLDFWMYLGKIPMIIPFVYPRKK